MFLAGCISLVNLATKNNRLDAEVKRLEAELGKLSIDDVNRVYLAEIETPDIPSEVAAHVVRVWQFRCYLPAGYDFLQLSGDGRVTPEGIYQAGGHGSNWGTPKTESTHKLFTISLQWKDNRLVVSRSFNGLTGTTSWSGLDPERFDTLIVQKLVSSDQGPRSFSQDTILPLLKIFDPSTADEKIIAGKPRTTYAGGLIILCPKSRESLLSQLRSGETPAGFEPDWLATEVSDE